ncbi:MAG: GNAT family N-acetyltransferase [Oscillospiraceae bacterium]|nr:GNAT family N-acetyltransferase [Oscillospiraceae bacterium]
MDNNTKRNLDFIAVNPNHNRQMRAMRKLWLPYWIETTTRNGEKAERRRKIYRRLKNRVLHAEKTPKTGFYVLYFERQIIGFSFFGLSGGIKAVDIPPDYGMIMEFYIAPPFRRKGFATEMNNRIEELFRSWGVSNVFLTPDPVTGRPFWQSIGYEDSLKADPDDQRPIYIKVIRESVV